jgi:hypothetical protein
VQIKQTVPLFHKDTTPYEQAAHLGQHIWSQIFPHAEGMEDRWRAFRSDATVRASLPDDVKGQPVPGVPVAVGDVLIGFDRSGKNARRQTAVTTLYTQHEIVASGGNIYKVVKVSPSGKSIDVVLLARPSGYWQNDLVTLSVGHDPTPERFVLESASRELGRLGTYEEILERIHAHVAYPAWQEAREASNVLFTADEAERLERTSKINEERRALQVHVDTVNRETRMTLLEITYSGKPLAVDRFLNKPGTLHVFIAGLAATGHLSLYATIKVQDALKALGL